MQEAECKKQYAKDRMQEAGWKRQVVGGRSSTMRKIYISGESTKCRQNIEWVWVWVKEQVKGRVILMYF